MKEITRDASPFVKFGENKERNIWRILRFTIEKKKGRFQKKYKKISRCGNKRSGGRHPQWYSTLITKENIFHFFFFKTKIYYNLTVLYYIE
jgi:hypothetical protein